ncbi:MAG: FAD-dependent oxidoreductase [Planctomycetes bacterium]|nr:FAD-dependent oxidoreductase [Planctomycetota bacterium]
MLKVVIIGAVAAGMSTAAKLKRLMKDDVDIVVFEQGDDVSFAACGIPYYVSGKIADASELRERRVEDFKKSGIDVRTGHRVTAVNTADKTVSVTVLATGAAVTEKYDKLVVASGARVRKIPPRDAD